MSVQTVYEYSVNTNFSEFVVNSDYLKSEIQQSSITTTLDYITIFGDACKIIFSDALSANDNTTLDNVVATHTPKLKAAKTNKFDQIDSKTNSLINNGFTFASKTFSLSLAGQSTLLGLDLLRNDIALTYPIYYNSIDYNDVLEITDSITVHNMVLTAVGTYRAHKDSGTALKDQVRAATTVAGVEGIVDNR